MEISLHGMRGWKTVNREGTKPWNRVEVEKMFQLKADGWTNRRIAEKLGRGVQSVQSKLQNLKYYGVEYDCVDGFSLSIIEDDTGQKIPRPNLKCLCCRKTFESRDARKNRVCSSCKESETWR
jgi:uncharacterized CHY-type Zn-finger protein